LVKAIAERGVAVDPTLVVFRNMIYLNDLPSVQDHPDQKLAPRRMREYWESFRQQKPLKEETRDARQREVKKYQELTGILYRAGVKILTGTDTPEPFVTPGFSVHQELEMLVESGLPPSAALQAATINNARILRQSEKLGRVEPGMLADLVILEADPTQDIRNTRRIDRVIRSGRVVVPSELLRRVPKD
jgi:imidazolonepropionase-like amidohydrolase